MKLPKIIQALLERIPGPFRNKYFLTLVIFFGWMIFFDKHNIITQWRLQNSVNRLEEDKVLYTKKIEEAKEELEDFDESKERVARENYYMKKPNEDVFIIVEEE